MEDIPETYDLETIEQLRSVADPLRIRIYEALAVNPRTATQVGEELDEPAPKTHYHVRELERVGLVRLVETRERGGILEKYYRAVARGLRVPPSILQQAPPDEVAAAMGDILDGVVSGFKNVMSQLIARKVTDWNSSMLTLSSDTLWMTSDEYERTLNAALELLKPYNERRGIENEREITMTVLSYDVRFARQRDDDRQARSTSASPSTPPTSQIPQIQTGPGSAADQSEASSGKAPQSGRRGGGELFTK